MDAYIQDYIFPNLEKEMKKSTMTYQNIADAIGMHIVTLNNKRIGYIRWRKEDKENLKAILNYEGSIEELFYSEYNTRKPKPKNKRLKE